MKNKKFKGFSLAELLISLLIISIVLSAAIPTLTRRAGAGREFIWRWSQQQNNNAYFGVGSNQSAIIGADAIPFRGSGLEAIFNDGEINIAGLRFTNNGDKLVLVKKPQDFDELGSADFNNSHISFYNAESSKEDATTSDITYTGRIATGQHDLAFGIGTLQSLAAVDTKNTAIGHYSLLKNTTGFENTAIGEKALSFNVIGKKNTAVGYKSLFNEGFSADETVSTGGTPTESSSNTAVGHLSATALQAGSSNSVLGAQALSTLAKGDDNVVLGSEGLIAVEEGSRNVVVGSQACSVIKNGNNNICIGNNAGVKNYETGEEVRNLNYGLFIGSSENDSQSMPIISGHSQKTKYKINNVEKEFDKELDINTRIFSVRPYNGGTNIFQVNAYANSAGLGKAGDGYGTKKGDGYTGNVLMHFRGDSGKVEAGKEAGISLSFAAGNEVRNGKNYALIGSLNYDIYKELAKTNNIEQAKNQSVINLSFNDFLDFDFPRILSKENPDGVVISMLTSAEGYSLNLNNQIQMNRQGDAPTIKLDAGNGFLLKTKDKLNFQIAGNYMQLYDDTDKVKFFVSTDPALPSLQYKYSPSSFSIDKYGITFNLQQSTDKISTFAVNDSNVTFRALNGKSDKVSGPNIEIKFDSDLEKTFKNFVGALSQLYYNIMKEINPSSDARLKNISGDNTAGLKEINALEVKNFTYKADKNKTPHVGVIAQQLQKVFPNSVFKGEDGYLRINKDEIFYAMVNSIKELFKQIQDLTAKITGLDKRITELEKQNAQLKKQNAEFEKRLSKLEKASR